MEDESKGQLMGTADQNQGSLPPYTDKSPLPAGSGEPPPGAQAGYAQPPPGSYPPTQGQPGYPPQQQGGYPPQQGYPAPQQQGYPPQQQGYPPQQQGYPPQQPGATVVSIQQPATQVVVTGNCPSCHMGNMYEGFTTCGIIVAICFFPLGIICCLMMKEKRCSNCGATFG